MATRDDIQAVLDRVNRDQQRPVPISTDAFGKKFVHGDIYQMGLTLEATRKLLENLLSDGIKG